MSAFSCLAITTAPSTFDDLYHRLTTHCRPDTVTYKYCISIRSNINTLTAVEEADSLLNDLFTPNDRGLRPDHNLFAIVLQAYLQLNVKDLRGWWDYDHGFDVGTFSGSEAFCGGFELILEGECFGGCCNCEVFHLQQQD